MQKRIEFIDIAKGFAILSVLVAHLNTFLNWHNEICAFVIASYFMPVFFFISGFFTQPFRSLNLRQKFNQLVIPYLSICLLICLLYSCLFNENFIERYLFTSSKGGYWFLLTLFFFYFVYSVILKIINYGKVKYSEIKFISLLLFAWMLIILSTELLPQKWGYLLSITDLRRFFPSFIFGIIAGQVNQRYNIWNNRIMIVSGVVYLSILLLGYNDKTISGFILWILASSCACVFLLNMFRVLENRFKFLIRYGKNSLTIYIYHYIFIYLLEYIIPYSWLNELYSWNTWIIFIIYIILVFLMMEASIVLGVITKKMHLGFLIGT